MTSCPFAFGARVFFLTFSLAVGSQVVGCSSIQLMQGAQSHKSGQPPVGVRELALAQQQYSSGDHTLALSSLLQSARLGNSRAEELLVSTFENKCWRIGVHQAEDFLYTFQSAAQRNDPFGLTVIGLMREFGFSPASADFKVARGYYARAEAQGSSIAKSRLNWLNQNASALHISSASSLPAACML